METEGSQIRLVIFDLDYTLWNHWTECTVPPYSMSHGRCVDKNGLDVDLYPDVPRILGWLQAQSIPIGVASRTPTPRNAIQILETIGIYDMFGFKEIYPDKKTTHFSKIQEQSGIPYEKMLFFDDEQRNIDDVSALGVKAILAKQGMTWDMFSQVVGSNQNEKSFY